MPITDHKRFLSVPLFALLISVAAHGGTPQPMRSIIIESHERTERETPLSPRQRAYWHCVLEHVKGNESNEALNVILAACRALSGDSK